MAGHRSTCRGGVGGVVVVVDLVQQRREEAAGGGTCIGGSGRGRFRRCAARLDKPGASQRTPKRGEEVERGRRAQTHWWALDSSRIGCWHLRAPATNCDGLAEQSETRRRGKWRGGREPFIVAAGDGMGKELRRN
jgi:hypothetical protein